LLTGRLFFDATMNDDINNAIKVLRNGGVILYPTDTVWGLGCNASDEKAVERIYKIKQRADTKSMLVLVDKPSMIDYYVDNMPDIAWDLIELTEEPLTIIYDKAKNFAKNLIAQDGSIGIRVGKDEFVQKLISRFRAPIVSTSANVSGEKTPQNFAEISQEIIDSVDYVVKYRQDDYSKRKPSKIIKLKENGEFVILR
jgi:L-threonylcarbamoyladenylate synthase